MPRIFALQIREITLPALGLILAVSTIVTTRMSQSAHSCLLALGLSLSAILGGCGESYCQSGPKYGTQCYSQNDVEWQRTQQREEPWPDARTTQPSPGCALATAHGLAQQPYSPNASSSAQPPYLMSSACISRQQPVYGAVR